MKKDSSKFILTISIILLLIIAITLIVTLNKYGVITGRASDEGAANLTISSQASISFTDAECNFQEGSVDEEPTFALVNSSGSVINGTGWDDCTDGLNLSNDGNVNVSVTLSSNGDDASTFITGTSPSFQIKAVSSSCDGTDSLENYTEVSGGAQNACTNWAAGESMQIDFNLTIPEDATGTHGALITATGTA
jgi:Tfp pilus assembly protein PilX